MKHEVIGKKEDKISVVLADDHALVRTGIRLMLEQIGNYEIVAEASGGLEALRAIEEHRPELLILDLQMPNLGGMEVLGRLSSDSLAPKVLVVSAVEPGRYVSDVISKGASGFLPKEVSKEEFEMALQFITNDKKYVSPSVSEYLEYKTPEGVLEVLSDREKEVFKLLAEGKKNKEIAKLLYISSRTIDTHRLNILKKLGLKTNAELANLAQKHDLI
jgi:DNA-binding NarL/FixJ family response regulator